MKWDGTMQEAAAARCNVQEAAAVRYNVQEVAEMTWQRAGGSCSGIAACKK